MLTLDAFLEVSSYPALGHFVYKGFSPPPLSPCQRKWAVAPTGVARLIWRRGREERGNQITKKNREMGRAGERLLLGLT